MGQINYIPQHATHRDSSANTVGKEMGASKSGLMCVFVSLAALREEAYGKSEGKGRVYDGDTHTHGWGI